MRMPWLCVDRPGEKTSTEGIARGGLNSEELLREHEAKQELPHYRTMQVGAHSTQLRPLLTYSHGCYSMAALAQLDVLCRQSPG